MKELSAQEQREKQGTAAKQQLTVVPCPPRAHINDQHTNFPIWEITDHKWKPLILVFNFLFGLRVNEIPNKTFILDSHQPSICSVFFCPQKLIYKSIKILYVSIVSLQE
jgi:hypothetical protein